MTIIAEADPSVGEFLLWCLWIFLFVVWFWLLITVFADLFRRHDISGWLKVVWFLFVLVFPFLGILVYLISQSKGMAERNVAAVKAQEDQLRQMAASPADELLKLDQLKASGSISDEEYQTMRARVVG